MEEAQGKEPQDAATDAGWVAAELDEEARAAIGQAFENAAATAGSDFGEALRNLDEAVSAVHPMDLICALPFYFLTTAPAANPEYNRPEGIFQHHVELIHAVALRRSFSEAQPSRSLQDGLSLTLDAAKATVGAFITLAGAREPVDESDAARHRSSVLYHLRVHGAVVRGATYYSDQAEVLAELFAPLDDEIERVLGFRCTALVSWWWAVCAAVEDRLNAHRELVREASQLPIDERWPGRFADIFPRLPFEIDSQLMAQLAEDEDQRVAFAVVAGDLNLFSVFGFELRELKDLYPGEVTDEALIKVLNTWSLELGDLADVSLDTLVAINPVLRAPIFRLDESHYLWTLFPTFIHSAFPMLEALMAGNRGIEKAYYGRRAKYLEATVADRLEVALPGARVFRNLVWRDPDDDKNYESDLLILVGSHALVVECKGGRVSSQALRGKGRALRSEIDELIVAPALQAQRFARFLESHPEVHRFRSAGGDPVVVDARTIRSVITLTVTLETLMTLLPRLSDVVGAGLTGEQLDAVTYCLCLFDLMVMLEMLEHPSEILHYLKRRGEIENGRLLIGQENDLLGLYLKLGLNLGEAEFTEGSETGVLGMSGEIDTYHYSVEAGIDAKKPRMRRTSWWEELPDKVESRLGPSWSEIGVALCNVAFEEQKELERGLERLQEIAAKTDEPQLLLFANGPPQRCDYFLGVIVTAPDTESRKEQINEAGRVAFDQYPEAERIIVLGWPPNGRGRPYLVLAVLTRDARRSV
jgi:hypothetical protein